MDEVRHDTAAVPPACVDKLVVTETVDAVLLYDTGKHHIHHLNVTTGAIWRFCDGRHTVAEVARLAGEALEAPVDEAAVRLALTQLDDAGLLQQPLADELRMSRISRRVFLRRAGGAGAIAIPAIASTTVPTVAQVSPACSCQVDSDCEGQCAGRCHFPSGLCMTSFCGANCTYSFECRDFTCTECRNDICQEPQGAVGCGFPCQRSDECFAQSEECRYCVGGYCDTEEPKFCSGWECTDDSDCIERGCPSCYEGFCTDPGPIGVCDDWPCANDDECTDLFCPDCVGGYCGTRSESGSRRFSVESTAMQAETTAVTETPPPTDVRAPIGTPIGDPTA